MTTFDRTIAALKEYDFTKPVRDMMFDNAACNEDVEACVYAEREAQRLVQTAFYEDTKHINRLENCLRVDVSDLRKMVAKSQVKEKT